MTEAEKLQAEIYELYGQIGVYKAKVNSLRKELAEKGFDMEHVDAFVREKLIEKGYKPEEIYDAIQI